jgi:hypothetical protein
MNIFMCSVLYTHISIPCHGACDAQEVPDAIQRIDMLMPSAAWVSHTGYRATTIGGGFRNTKMWQQPSKKQPCFVTPWLGHRGFGEKRAWQRSDLVGFHTCPHWS